MIEQPAGGRDDQVDARAQLRDLRMDADTTNMMTESIFR